MMIRSGVGRKLPSLFRFYCSSSSVSDKSNSPLHTFASSGEFEQQQQKKKNERTPLAGSIVTRGTTGISGFSRGFASIGETDALSATHGGLPATLVALKNPTNQIVYDDVVHERYPPGDPSKRAFTYFVLTGGRFIYASALRLLVLKFVLSMSASRDVLALASLEVDLASIEPGATVTVKWRGKPVFIRHRTEDDIKLASNVNLGELRDPEPDSDRVQDPQWLIVVGVCTHLGCVPLPNAGDYGGWFCPCHGSHYDISGRARKGPAPYNLEVPTYKFMEEGKLLIG